MLILKVSFLLFALFSQLNAMPDFFSAAHEKKKNLGITLVSNLDIRKTQLNDLEKNITQKKKHADDIQKSTNDALALIKDELQEAQASVKTLSDANADLMNKKIMFLNDRKQNFLDYLELSKDYVELAERHRKLIEETIEFLKAPQPPLKPMYSWKEFRDAQIRISEHAGKIQIYKVKRDNLKKQKTAAHERLSSWERQRDVKNKERENLVAQGDTSTKAPYADTVALKYQADILAQEINVFNERIENTKLLIQKLDDEIKYWDDFIDLEENKAHEQKNNLDLIEARLILDYNDIEIARAEWKNQVKKTLITKEEINNLQAPKKKAKEKLNINLDVLKQRLIGVKQAGTKEQVTYLSVKSQVRKMAAQLQAMDKELSLLDAKKDLADILAHEKEQQFNMVELRYKLKIDEENLGVLFATFKNKTDLSFSTLRGLKDKRTETISSLIETNRAIEKINITKENLREKRPTIFKGQEQSLSTILSSLEDTKAALTQQLEFDQSYLAVNADLITHQEKIISQYHLIINELEIRHKTHSIWKRSPKAISLEAFGRAALEAESFFKKLYWETPSHLKPSAFFASVRSWSLYELLMLLSIILLYLVSFAICRLLLTFFIHKGKQVLESYQGRSRHIMLHIALTIAYFVLEHFSLLFTWFFIYFNIATGFSYLSITLAPFISNYSVAMFHLLSIPLFIYLAKKFVDRVKQLNQQLSYFFVDEALQDNFTLLITAFCYATAILLPLRVAILSYTDTPSANIATVILGAYVLILSVVLLLFFNKDRVLAFTPQSSPLGLWFKRSIDKHYYPVFLFVMGLLIISNPYIGYSNMAWFLAFAVPSSVFLLYLLFILHFYIRKYSVFLFMKEDDDEMIDKFEHAKAYYGFFIIFSFLALSFVAFILILRMWGIDYTPTDMWKALSEQWVIRFSIDNKLGLIEFTILGLFLTAGFLVSSFLHKFVLNRLFDILRSEPGTQNTISRIAHYTTVFIAIVLGLNVIHLEQFIFWVGASFGIVLGLAMKEIVSDLVAGFFVLIERPIEIGNFISIDSIQGTVHKISARSTTIITSRNHSIIIPNKDLITKWITNWGHGRFAVGFEINVRVMHNTDPEVVKRTLLGVVQAHPFILKVPGIVVRLEDFEDDSLYFLVRAFISARRVKEQWEIAAVLRNEIIKAFKELDISLARPERIIEFHTSATTPKGPKGIEIKFDPSE